MKTMEQTVRPASRRELRRADPLGSELLRFWDAPWGLLDWPRLGRDLEGWTPRVDVIDQGQHLLIKADLPGVKKEDVEITLEGGDLVLRGERKDERETQHDDYYRMERASGTIFRRISLPFEVDPKSIHARFEDGVLRIEIPTPPEIKPESRKIPIH